MSKKDKCIKLVERILYSRRNNDVKTEQKYYTELITFCEKHNINFENAYEGALKELKKRIAPNMNGGCITEHKKGILYVKK